MCCSTGVCGTDTNPKLVQFASDLNWIAAEGAQVTRFNLAQQPDAFVKNAAVNQALTARGTDCLPIVVVDGVLVSQSIYPTREQLAQLAGIEVPCCGGGESKGGSGCCS